MSGGSGASSALLAAGREGDSVSGETGNEGKGMGRASSGGDRAREVAKLWVIGSTLS